MRNPISGNWEPQLGPRRAKSAFRRMHDRRQQRQAAQELDPDSGVEDDADELSAGSDIGHQEALPPLIDAEHGEEAP